MPAAKFEGFPPETVKFLKGLQRNNDRDWFNKRKDDYEKYIVEPSLAFIESMQGPMAKISELFNVTPKKTGGSLMRIYRDTRFGKDKTPYKTNIGIHFRHQLGRDIHAPGYYIHIEPSESFLGVGIWHPSTAIQAQIRTLIQEETAAWKKARAGKKFTNRFELAGDSLKRPPRGVDPASPWIDDLKRKDFIGVEKFPVEEIESADFSKKVAASFQSATPFMRFLCDAIGAPM